MGTATDSFCQGPTDAFFQSPTDSRDCGVVRDCGPISDPLVGACCIGQNRCIDAVPNRACTTLGGRWQGIGSACSGINCVTPSPFEYGRCCMAPAYAGASECEEMSSAQCAAIFGSFSALNICGRRQLFGRSPLEPDDECEYHRGSVSSCTYELNNPETYCYCGECGYCCVDGTCDGTPQPRPNCHCCGHEDECSSTGPHPGVVNALGACCVPTPFGTYTCLQTSELECTIGPVQYRSKPPCVSVCPTCSQPGQFHTESTFYTYEPYHVGGYGGAFVGAGTKCTILDTAGVTHSACGAGNCCYSLTPTSQSCTGVQGAADCRRVYDGVFIGTVPCSVGCTQVYGACCFGECGKCWDGMLRPECDLISGDWHAHAICKNTIC